MIPRHQIKAHHAEKARQYLEEHGPAITSEVMRGGGFASNHPAYDALCQLEKDGMARRKPIKVNGKLCVLWQLVTDRPEAVSGLVNRAISSRTPIERAWGHIGEHA